LSVDQSDAIGKLKPVVPPRGPEELRRPSEARVSEAANRHAKSPRQAFGAEEHTSSANRAEKAVDEASGIASMPVLPRLAGDAHSGFAEERGVGEGAAAAALAVSATAQIDVDGLAACGDRQIAAIAMCDAFRPALLVSDDRPP
jgi:hypothetical protein